MNHNSFKKWLDELGDAWISKNPQAAANICEENVTYYEDPFQEPLKGRAAVYKTWQDVPQSQKDILYKYDILTVTDSVGVARWSASFTRLPSGVRSELDGIYVVKLNNDGLCSEFHQWWNSKGS